MVRDAGEQVDRRVGQVVSVEQTRDGVILKVEGQLFEACGVTSPRTFFVCLNVEEARAVRFASRAIRAEVRR